MPKIKHSKLMETTFSTSADLQFLPPGKGKGVILQKCQDHNRERQKAACVLTLSGNGLHAL